MSKPLLERARELAALLEARGATDTLIVGGWVRDHLLGSESKDLDLEVYGLATRDIVAALEGSHRVDVVGESFGVIKVDGDIDVSIPRRENKRGVGHTGFDVEPDPGMTREEAAARRDFTINALSMTPEGEIVDPVGGRDDLERGVLRAVSPAFGEDPLRVLRGMQFAARFDFSMEERTVEMCRRLRSEASFLAAERIFEEWSKWAVKGVRPSAGIRVLEETGWIECFPEIAAMDAVPQDPGWHPEGEVLTHVKHVCDAAAAIAAREKLDERDRRVLLFAALLHDVGKPPVTVRNEEGRWISPGHSSAGVPLSRAFLERMRAPAWLVEQIEPLVREHMVHIQGPVPSDRAVRRLSHRLGPSSLRLWSLVCEADHNGRPPLPPGNPVTAWLEIADRLEVEDSGPKPLVLGRHLLSERLAEPGPQMGDLLARAFEAQLDGEFDTVEAGVDWIRRRLAEG